MYDGPAKSRCDEASQLLGSITRLTKITSEVHEFHISCMNNLSTKFTLESCFQLPVTDYSNHSCFIEKPNIQCSVNFRHRQVFKELTKEETLLQASLSYRSLH